MLASSIPGCRGRPSKSGGQRFVVDPQDLKNPVQHRGLPWLTHYGSECRFSTRVTIRDISNINKRDPTELNKLDAGVAGSSLALQDTDSFIIGDATAGNETKKVLLSDMKTYIGGGSVAVTSGSANFTGSIGINHFGDVGGAIECRMPALVAPGESVIFKAGKDCSTTNTITIKMSGSGKADGLTEVVLESPYAAVELMYVAADTWRVF